MLVIVQPSDEPGKPPICKIIDKKEMYNKEKERKKKLKSSATSKTIELNWALDGNDLKHRIVRMQEFLGKGYKLEVVLAPKRKGRVATEEEAEELLRNIRAAVEEVKGSRETATMSGTLLATATLFFEGKIQKQTKEEKAEAKAAEREKQRKKERLETNSAEGQEAERKAAASA